MEIREHRLKTWPSEFAAVKSGLKRFEWRYCGDRDFAVGDRLILEEFEPKTRWHTGELCTVYITSILQGRFGVPDNYAVLGIDFERPQTIGRVFKA